MIVLSKEDMYFYDNFTIEHLNIPGKTLMENAGKGCFDFIRDNILKEGKFIVFAGTGNNAGDGFVISRYLKENNHQVKLIVTGNPEKMSEETKENYEKCINLDIDISLISSFDEFMELHTDLQSYDLIIDAIFGVGLTGDVNGWKADLINHINKSGTRIVSIDIPSGMNANTGEGNPIIRADYTLTMAAIKQGMILENGRRYTGILKVIDIGIPQKAFEDNPPKAFLIDDNSVKYPQRDRLAHKGKYGKTVIIAGSPGFSGAAIMASKAALRAGAGLLYLLHPEGMELIFETQLLEVMTKPIATISGNINFFEIKDFLKDKTALLIGPGLGVNEYSYSLLDYLSKNWNKPLVIDADGLNTIAKYKMIDKFSGKPVLLTPHIGEFSRITNIPIDDINAHKVEILKDFCMQHKVNILLKGATTIFSNGDVTIFDTSGNDGLATGGSGDVLAGIIVSFLSQGLSINDAAISASYLMGKTAEYLENYRYTPSIIPSDIIDNLFVKKI